MSSSLDSYIIIVTFFSTGGSMFLHFKANKAAIQEYKWKLVTMHLAMGEKQEMFYTHP